MKGDPDFEHAWVAPTFHFYIVSGASLLAACCSGIIGWLGARLRNANIVILALGFMSLCAFLALHGLATPGFILESDEMYHLPGVATQLGLTFSAVWFFLSTLPANTLLVQFISNFSRWLTVGWATTLVLCMVIGLEFPDSADTLPIDSHPLQYFVMIATITLFLWTGKTYFQRYRFARFPVQIAVVYSVIWLCVTQIDIMTSSMWTTAWWFYHVLLILATGVVLYAVMQQYSFDSPLTKSFQTMFGDGLLERIQSGISPSIQALIRATEAKDAYTAGHNLRVTMYALQLADELKLAPELQRALAQGGIVHDVGKVYVPESILNKPGALTRDERIVIERHPVTGYEMCVGIGFMKSELDVIRHHHEKWDGTGYPDQLKGTQIPLLARILAVADVYDALTSERAYREPWSHDRATEFITMHSGTHFDPVCVDAFSRVYKAGGLSLPQQVQTAQI